MMKKILFLLTILHAISVSAQLPAINETAVVDLGEFVSYGKSCKASVYLTKDSTKVLYYRIEPIMTSPTLYKSEKQPWIYLLYTPDLMDKLKSVVDKYKEWDKIARDNKVGKFDKNIEIEIPQFAYLETKTSNSKKTNGIDIVEIKDNHKFKFLFNGMEKPSVLSFVTKDDRKSNLMPYLVIFAFWGIDEIDGFMKLIDPQQIKHRIETNTTGSLFK